jgi:23S rRNA (adenine2503-C2)-methyltransferase
MLIPLNRQTGINILLDSSRRYFEKTGRRVSFEYALIDEVNDTAEHAKKLSTLLSETPGHLNLILLSHVQEKKLKPAGQKSVKRFTDELRANNINFTIRRSLGSDIEAACGQLRRRLMQNTIE